MRALLVCNDGDIIELPTVEYPPPRELIIPVYRADSLGGSAVAISVKNCTRTFLCQHIAVVGKAHPDPFVVYIEKDATAARSDSQSSAN